MSDDQITRMLHVAGIISMSRSEGGLTLKGYEKDIYLVIFLTS